MATDPFDDELPPWGQSEGASTVAETPPWSVPTAVPEDDEDEPDELMALALRDAPDDEPDDEDDDSELPDFSASGLGSPAASAFSGRMNLGGPKAQEEVPPWGVSTKPAGYSEDDLDKAVRTVWGEAAGEPPEGQQAVAAVIANRAHATGRSPGEIVMEKGQFEPWATRRRQLESLDPTSPEYQRIALTIAPVLAGEVDDPTGGATHFYSPRAQAGLGRKPPSWDDGTGFDIGGHRFFRHGYGGKAAAAPQQIASGGGDPLAEIMAAPPEKRRELFNEFLRKKAKELGVPTPEQAEPAPVIETPPWGQKEVPPWGVPAAAKKPVGNGIIEGLTDPQQYKEGVKGIVPGAVSFGGSMLKGAASADPVEAIAQNAQRYVDDLKRVPQMTSAELSAFRQRVEKEPAQATRIAVQSTISDLLDGSQRIEDVVAQFAPPKPLAERPLYKAGDVVGEYSKTILPAAPGYEKAVGRQLGEGLGSMFAGLPAAFLGVLPAGMVFGAAGMGEAAERAIEFDKKERKAGRPGLSQEQINTAAILGVGPGTTDIVPIEIMLHGLPVAPAFKHALAQGIARIGGQAFVEGFQEGGQQFLQNLIAREIYNPKQALGEEVLGNVGVGAGVGGLAQAGKELGTGAVRLAGRRGGRAGTRPDIEPTEAPEAPGAEIPAGPPSLPGSPPAAFPGVPPEKLGEMAPQGEVSGVRDQGSESPLAPETYSLNPSFAPDQPTAEPFGDLMAQAKDLADAGNIQRQALYLPEASVAALDERQARQLRQVLGEGRAVIEDFAGDGGYLIVKSQEVLEAAEKARDAGVPVQTIIGVLTGSGVGKPAGGTAVVQQTTPQGDVTRERVVTPDEMRQVMAEFAQRGRDVRAVAPQEVLARREDRLGSSVAPVGVPAGAVIEPSAQDLSNAARGPGSPAAPVRVEAPEDVAVAGLRVAEPTEAQRAAGNYRKGHADFQGLKISIETPKGGVRRGAGWETVSPAAYGYFKGTAARARDKEHVDVYVGDNPTSDRAFIIDQHDLATGRFDEPKVIVGVGSAAEAAALYDAGFSDGKGPQRRRAVSELSIADLKEWLQEGDATQPFAPFAEQAAPAERADLSDEQIENILDLTDEDINDLVEQWYAVRAVRDEHTRDAKKLKIAAELEKDLNDYGITSDAFTSEAEVREHLGQEPQAAAQEDAGAAGAAALGEPAGPAERGAAVSAEDADQRGAEPAAVGEGAGTEDGRPSRAGEAGRGADVAGEAVGSRQSAVEAEPKLLVRYDGPALDQDQVDYLVDNWRFVHDVDRRAQPLSLSAFVVAEGGLKDDAKEVRHIAGAARERPGLVNKNGVALDDAALKAWKYGFFPHMNERPTVAEFLDKLQDDLHTGAEVRWTDERALDDIQIASGMAEELADYGITAKSFRSEQAVRRHLAGGGQGQAGAVADEVGSAARGPSERGPTAGRQVDVGKARGKAPRPQATTAVEGAQADEAAKGELPELAGQSDAAFERGKDEARGYVLSQGREHTREFGAVVLPDGTMKPNKISPDDSESTLRVDAETAPDLYFGAPRSVDGHHNHPKSTSLSRDDYVKAAERPAQRRTYVHGHDGSEYWAYLKTDPETIGRAYDIATGVTLSADGKGILRYRTHLIALMLEEAGLTDYGATLAPANAEKRVAALREQIGEDAWSATVDRLEKLGEKANVSDRSARPTRGAEGMARASAQSAAARPEPAGGQAGDEGRARADTGRRRGEREEVEESAIGAAEEEVLSGNRLHRVGEKQPSGFYFLAGRKLAEVPEGLFPQGGQAVINWLRKEGVKRAEINHFQLVEKFGDKKPVTRDAFAKAIAERMFDFRRKTSWLNPERSDNSYEMKGTRAFRGPRIPGRGIYFEDLLAFPKKLAGGERFAPGMFQSPHWPDELKTTWFSRRGSLRDVPGWGRMLIDEEKQADAPQGANTGSRPRIEQKEFFEFKGKRAQYNRVMDRARELAGKAVRATGLDDDTRYALNGDLAPTFSRREYDLEAWKGAVESTRDAIREQRGIGGAATVALESLDKLEALRAKHKEFFVPGAFKKFAQTERAFTPASPLDDSYVTNMVRTLLLDAVKLGADSIAIPTTETNDRIQNNTRKSAGHFYDQQLKPRIEKELQRLSDAGSITALKLVELPRALGAPKKEKPYTVWAAKLWPKAKEAIADEDTGGLSMFAIGSGAAPPSSYRDRVRATIATMQNEGAGNQQIISATTALRREEFARLRVQGVEEEKIAELLGVSQRRVREYGKALGVERRDPGWKSQKFWAENDAKVVDLFKGGLTLSQIAKRFDVTRNTIGNRLRANGISPREEKREPHLTIGGSNAKAASQVDSADELTRDKVGARLAKGETVNIPNRVVGAVLRAVKPHMDLVPDGTSVGAVTRLEPVHKEEGLPYDTQAFFRTHDGQEKSLLINWRDLSRARALATIDGRLIGFLRLEVPAEIGKGAVGGGEANIPRSVIAHEAIHARRRLGLLGGALWRRLVSHGDSLRLLDKELGTYFKEIDEPALAANAKPNVTMRDWYTQYNLGQPDFQARMDEEAVAVMAELAEHGTLLPQQVSAIRDDLAEAFGGPPSFESLLDAKMEGAPAYALGSEGASQRKAFDSLGFYSALLEAAKDLQKEGTPEQMLEQLLDTAGVKEAEIRATKLDEFLLGKTLGQYFADNAGKPSLVLSPERRAAFQALREEVKSATGEHKKTLIAELQRLSQERKAELATFKNMGREGGETSSTGIRPSSPEAPIVQFRKDAAAIEAALPPVAEGHARLWRGNRAGAVIGRDTSFTNDLPGIALPFRKSYGGALSYVDVPTADLAKYESKAGAAPGAEFSLPQDIAGKAIGIRPSSREVPAFLYRGEQPGASTSTGFRFLSEDRELASWHTDKTRRMHRYTVATAAKTADVAGFVSRETGAIAPGMDADIREVIEMAAREFTETPERFVGALVHGMGSPSHIRHQDRLLAGLRKAGYDIARLPDNHSQYGTPSVSVVALNDDAVRPHSWEDEQGNWQFPTAGEEGRTKGAARKSISRQEIISYLEENRVEVREAVYGGIQPLKDMIRAEMGEDWSDAQIEEEALSQAQELGFESIAAAAEGLGEADDRIRYRLLGFQGATENRGAKWATYSLDPSNPTYRESVLYLPAPQSAREGWERRVGVRLDELPPKTREQMERKFQESLPSFTDSHFPNEPNPVVNTGTSIQKDSDGKSVGVLDRFQPQWAQNIRDARRNAWAGKLFGPGTPHAQQRIKEAEAAIADWESKNSNEDLALQATTLAIRLSSMRRTDPKYSTVKAEYDAATAKQGDLGRLQAELRSATSQKPFRDLTKDQKAQVSAAISKEAAEGGAIEGVRDEAKIAELQKQHAELWAQIEDRIADAKTRIAKNYSARVESSLFLNITQQLQVLGEKAAERGVKGAQDDVRLAHRIWPLLQREQILAAELATAKAATPGHPLVNTTDQVLTTGLRRVLRQFIEAGVSQIAITPAQHLINRGEGAGGAAEGMQHFYDVMLPRAFLKLLQSYDPSIKMEMKPLQSSLDGRTFAPKVALDTEARGVLDRAGGNYKAAIADIRRQIASEPHPRARAELEKLIAALEAGQAKPILFHSFPLTDKVKEEVRVEGQPLFAIGGKGNLDQESVGESARPSQVIVPSEPIPGETLASSIPSPRISKAEQEDLSKGMDDALEIVNRIAGKDIKVVFRNSIGVGNELRGAVAEAAKALGTEAPKTVGGFYRPATRPTDVGLDRHLYDMRRGVSAPVLHADALIGLATNDPSYGLLTQAGHEAWHHVEEVLAMPAELKLLRSPAEMARMRRVAAADIGLEAADPRLERIPDQEIRAIAFGRYRREREEGMQPAGGWHIGVRRFFDRVLRLFHAVKNLLAGKKLGYADIFESARTGEMAERGALEANRGKIGEAYDREVFGSGRAPGELGNRAPIIGPAQQVWYHGTSDADFTVFKPVDGEGRRNTGGRGATFLTPFRTEAEGAYGGSKGKVIAVRSNHRKAFTWNLSDMRDTLGRAREVLPALEVVGDSIKTVAQQTAFFDALKRAGYDAVETRSAAGPAELAVFDASATLEPFESKAGVTISGGPADANAALNGSPKLLASSIPTGGPLPTNASGASPGGSAAYRQSLLSRLIPSAPLDRVMRIPFDIFGGTDEQNRWLPGLYLSEKAGHIITNATFSNHGRFTWINPILHKARAGLIDRYGLDPAYVERERQRGLEERRIMAAVPELMQTLKDTNIGPAEAKVLHAILTGEQVADHEWAKISNPIRNAIDQLGQEAVELGFVSAESYERNKGTYLHRVYRKHESDQGGLTRMINGIMGRHRQKILGEQFKGRGLWIDVPEGSLLRNLADANLVKDGDKFVVLDRLETKTFFSGQELDVETQTELAEAFVADERYRAAAKTQEHTTDAHAVAAKAWDALVKRAGQARAGTLINALRTHLRPSGLEPGMEGYTEIPQERVSDYVRVRHTRPDAIDDTLRSVTNDMEIQARSTHRVFLRESDPTPAKYAAYQARGTFEVRGKKRDRVILWRDWTKAERERMGEITDARYTIAKTYMLMAHDLAVGRFYVDVAGNADWATNMEPLKDTWSEANDYRYRLGADPDVEWVRVPDVRIPKSNTKRYGALAGMWVRAEIWRDIHELERMQTSGWWNTLLTQWKTNKTARSPVVHMNNVMSNGLFMDMADIRARDLVSGLRSLVKGDAMWQEAVDNGAFGSNMVAQEIRRNILQPILEEIEREAQGDQGPLQASAGLIGKVLDGIWSKTKSLDRKLVDLYGVEDEVFRMALFIRRRQQGASAKDAAIEARDQFVNYDIRAPWVNAARRSVLPFIGYMYGAAPVIAKSVMTRPWKLAKYITVGYALNALAYALLPGDEDRERRSMRENEQGRTWIGAPRMLRTPWADQYGNPIFLDIRRWIPAGDIFDLNQGQSPVPIPAPLQFGGPLMMGFELALNKQAFTGREIVNNKTADWWDKTAKISDWAWKSWMPSAAWVPGSWYWTKIENALYGVREPYTQRPYSLPLAVSSSFGVKLKPQDVQEGMRTHGRAFKHIEDNLKAEINRLAHDLDRGMLTRERYEKERQHVIDKLRNLGKRERETFYGKE